MRHGGGRGRPHGSHNLPPPPPATDIRKPQAPHLEPVHAALKTNVAKRVLLGVPMLISFIFLCTRGKMYIVAFNIALTAGICAELIGVVRRPGTPSSLPVPLVVFLAALIYTAQIAPALIAVFPPLASLALAGTYRTLLFGLYACALMWTVRCLRMNMLSTQLLLLAVIHLACAIVGQAGAFAIMNLLYGTFYYFYPALLVIANDIFAYAVGKIVGRTPLYALSPRKTREGFLGAALGTVLASILLIYLKLQWGFLPDAMDSAVRLPLSSSVWFMNFPIAYLHGVIFALFASFVAPFIGFLASAIKRAFKRKDFGDVIPGHGGLTDRMDCQLLMVFFTHYYIGSAFATRDDALGSLVQFIKGNYHIDEIMRIVAGISP